MFKVLCLLVLVASISATPTLLLGKKLALKGLLLAKLHGGSLHGGPIGYGAEPVPVAPIAPVAPVAPVAYAQPIAYAHPVTYTQPAPVYVQPAPAPQIIEARHAPAPAPVHHVVYVSQPQPQTEFVHEAPAVTYEAAPQPAATYGPPATSYEAAPVSFEAPVHHAVSYQAAPVPVTYAAAAPVHHQPKGFELTKRFFF